MTGMLSMILAVGILVALLMGAAVVVFDLLLRIRDRLYSSETQLKRAGLGHYPHWQA